MAANVSKAVCITYDPQICYHDRSSLVVPQLQTYHTQNDMYRLCGCALMYVCIVSAKMCVYDVVIS